MPIDLASLGMQTATGAIGGLMGMALAGWQDRRQLKQQENLQRLQEAGNRRMIDYQKQKDLEMWEATNYKAQMQQLEKAGLNPGMLYGMSGGGGVTTGGSGPGVSGGSAPQGGAEIQQMVGMGLQGGLIAAQAKLIDAQARNLDADTKNKQGVIPENIAAHTENLKATTNNTAAQTELTKLETDIRQIEEYIKGKTQNVTIAKLNYEAEEAFERLQLIKNTHKLSDATLQTQINIVKRQFVQMGIENALMESQKNLTDEQKKLTTQDIEVRMRDVEYYYDKLEVAIKHADAAKQNAAVNEFVNDVSESTKLPANMVEKIIQGFILRRVITGSQPNPIRGLHNR